MDLQGRRQSTNIEDARPQSLTVNWITAADFDGNDFEDPDAEFTTNSGIIIWRTGMTADWDNDGSHIWVELPEGSTVQGIMGQSPVTLSVEQTRVLRNMVGKMRRVIPVESNDGALAEMVTAMMRNAK